MIGDVCAHVTHGSISSSMQCVTVIKVGKTGVTTRNRSGDTQRWTRLNEPWGSSSREYLASIDHGREVSRASMRARLVRRVMTEVIDPLHTDTWDAVKNRYHTATSLLSLEARLLDAAVAVRELVDALSDEEHDDD